MNLNELKSDVKSGKASSLPPFLAEKFLSPSTRNFRLLFPSKNIFLRLSLQIIFFKLEDVQCLGHLLILETVVHIMALLFDLVEKTFVNSQPSKYWLSPWPLRNLKKLHFNFFTNFWALPLNYLSHFFLYLCAISLLFYLDLTWVVIPNFPVSSLMPALLFILISAMFYLSDGFWLWLGLAKPKYFMVVQEEK